MFPGKAASGSTSSIRSDGGDEGEDVDIFEEHGDERARSSAASVRRAAEALRGAAEAAAAEALWRRGTGRGGKPFLIDDATRAFLLRPGRSLRGFNALAGEFGIVSGGPKEDEKEEKGEGAAAAEEAPAAVGSNDQGATPTRDRNLVAARALALLSARELVRAASSTHRGLSYVLKAYFEMRFGALKHEFSPPTPTDWGAETARELLDEAWGDFLADARALEAAVVLRAFSASLDPLEEFKLEAGELFVQLLRRYRRQVASELLGGPEIVVHPQQSPLRPPAALPPRKQREGKEMEEEEGKPMSAARLRLLRDKARTEEKKEEKEERAGDAAEEEGGGGGGGEGGDES